MREYKGNIGKLFFLRYSFLIFDFFVEIFQFIGVFGQFVFLLFDDRGVVYRFVSDNNMIDLFIEIHIDVEAFVFSFDDASIDVAIVLNLDFTVLYIFNEVVEFITYIIGELVDVVPFGFASAVNEFFFDMNGFEFIIFVVFVVIVVLFLLGCVMDEVETTGGAIVVGEEPICNTSVTK